jgi:hypothetical protein
LLVITGQLSLLAHAMANQKTHSQTRWHQCALILERATYELVRSRFGLSVLAEPRHAFLLSIICGLSEAEHATLQLDSCPGDFERK